MTLCFTGWGNIICRAEGVLSQKENTYEVKKHLLSDGANTKTDSGAAAYSNIEDSSVTPEAIMAKGGHYAKCKPGEKVKEDTDKEHYYKLTFENSVGDFVKGGYSDSTGQHHGAVHLVERFYKKYQVYSCVYSYTVTNDKTQTVDYYYFIYIWRVLVDEDYHKATADDYLTYCIQYGIPINKSEAAYAKEKSVYNDLTPDEQYRLACAIYYGPHRASDGTYYSSLNKKAGDSVKCYDPSTWSKALFLRYSATQFYIWTVTDPKSFSVADAKKTAKQFDKDYQTANESCYDFLLSLIDYVDTAVKVPSFMKETKNQAQSTAVKLQQQTDGTYQKELKDSRGMLLTGSFTCSNPKVNVMVDSASRLILTSSEPVESAMLTFTKKQQVPKAKLGLLYYADGKSQNMVNPIAEAEDYHAYLAVQTAENHSDEGVISIYKEDEETRTVLSGAIYQVLTTSKTAAVYNPQTHTPIIDMDTGKTLDAAKFIAGYLYKDDSGYHLIPYTTENKAWIDNQGISECHIAYNIAYYCNGVQGYRISTRGNGEAQTEPLLRKKTTGTGANITTTWYSYYFIEVEPPEHYTLPYPVVLGEDGSLQKGQVCLKQNQGQTTWKEYELQLKHTNREIPGGLEIYKMDERDLKPLEGVVFHVYSDSDCTKLIAVLVTDNNGRASLSGLHSGDYYVQEMSGQDGYVVVRNLRQVYVLSGEQTIVEFFNEPVVVCISIQKQLDEQLKFADASQRRKAAAISLEGAEYALYAGSNIYGANGTLLFEKDAYIYTLRTDADGKASVPKEFSEEFLRQGEYYLVETVAPKGFLLNPEPVSVHAVSLSDPQCNENVDEYAQENVIYCNVTLRERPAQLRIHIEKVQKGLEKDVTEPLSGAAFSVFDLDRMRAEGILVTEDNIADFDFASGGYDAYRIVIGADAADPYVIRTALNGQAASVETEPLVCGRYAVAEVEAPYGYHLAAPQLVDVGGAAEQNMEVIYTTFTDVRKTGKIEIIKTGDMLTGCRLQATEYGTLYQPEYQKKPLADVEFELLDENMQYIDTLVTDHAGCAVSGELYYGAYYVREKKTAAGLVPDRTLYQAVVSEQADRVQINPILEIHNTRMGAELSVYKQGETVKNAAYGAFSLEWKPLKGVVFGIYNENPIIDKSGRLLIPKDSLLGIAETDDGGRALFQSELVPGDYYYQELKPLAGYAMDEEKHPFTLALDSNQDIERLELNKDTPLCNYYYKAGVRLRKVDSTDHEITLAGVKFGLYRSKTDELIGIYETDVKGEIYIEQMPYGEWYFKELQPAPGYQVDVLQYGFTVDERQGAVEILVENEPELSLGYDDDVPLRYYWAGITVCAVFGYFLMLWRCRCRK